MPNAQRVLLILVALVLASCGAPALPTGPSNKVTPPSGGGGGKYQCTNVSGKTDPWLVEWDGTHKARIQATSQSGVLLVRYSGCDMEVLYGCERQGEYKLVPTTPSASTEYITSEDALKNGEGIEVRGFGSFTVRQYKPYNGRNPRNGEAVHVASKRMPCFKVGKELRETVNGGAGCPP